MSSDHKNEVKTVREILERLSYGSVAHGYVTQSHHDVGYSPTDVDEAEAAINEYFVSVLGQLQTELREYHEKFPDADYYDISGYIPGFASKYKTKAQGETVNE